MASAGEASFQLQLVNLVKPTRKWINSSKDAQGWHQQGRNEYHYHHWLSNILHSSYSIIISKFRKVLGCVAMKVNLDIRHRRLQFVQRSREGARRAAAEQRNRRTGTFNHENGAWFNMQEEESTYAEYCRYRNAHRYDDARNNTFGRRNEWILFMVNVTEPFQSGKLKIMKF